MPVRFSAIICATLVAAGAGLAASGSVSNTLTSRDRVALHRLDLAANPVNVSSLSLPEQIRLIRAVQRKILTAAPIDKGIPEGSRRDLLEILKRGHGLCFDRSRSIETALRSLGFETRHVSVYSTSEHSAIVALATPQVPSHAVSEVKTRAGWMLVDSNILWTGYIDGKVLATEDIRNSPLAIRNKWGSGQNGLHEIFRNEFTFVYGLYSRHGQFYAPYTLAPDVNYKELLHNL